MDFLQELRDFLQHPVVLPAETRRALRRHFLAVLERREREGADPAWLEGKQRTLGRGLERFVSAVLRELSKHGIPYNDVH